MQHFTIRDTLIGGGEQHPDDGTNPNTTPSHRSWLPDSLDPADAGADVDAGYIVVKSEHYFGEQHDDSVFNSFATEPSDCYFHQQQQVQQQQQALPFTSTISRVGHFEAASIIPPATAEPAVDDADADALANFDFKPSLFDLEIARTPPTFFDWWLPSVSQSVRPSSPAISAPAAASPPPSAAARPHRCPDCPAAFRQPATLRQHRVIHSGARPHRCADCQRTYNRHSTLIAHRRTHGAHKQFACDLCPRRFHQKGNLRNHLYTHSNTRPYRCADCALGFNQMSNLRMHRRKAHEGVGGGEGGVGGGAAGPRLWPCGWCEAKFEQRAVLRAHEQREHIVGGGAGAAAGGGGTGTAEEAKAMIRRLPPPPHLPTPPDTPQPPPAAGAGACIIVPAIRTDAMLTVRRVAGGGIPFAMVHQLGWMPLLYRVLDWPPPSLPSLQPDDDDAAAAAAASWSYLRPASELDFCELRERTAATGDPERPDRVSVAVVANLYEMAGSGGGQQQQRFVVVPPKVALNQPPPQVQSMQPSIVPGAAVASVKRAPRSNKTGKQRQQQQQQHQPGKSAATSSKARPGGGGRNRSRAAASLVRSGAGAGAGAGGAEEQALKTGAIVQIAQALLSDGHEPDYTAIALFIATHW